MEGKLRVYKYSLSQVKAPNNFLCQKSILRVFLQGFKNLTTKLNKLKRTGTKKIIIERKWSDFKKNKLILNTIDLNNIPQFLQHTFKYSGIERKVAIQQIFMSTIYKT